MSEQGERGRRGRRRSGEAASAPARRADYRRLRNPFAPQSLWSEDRIEAIHDTAFRVLQELGLKVLLPEARERFAKAGALVDQDSAMVRIGRDIIEAALATAPARVELRAGARARDLTLEPGALSFHPGSGCPNVSDLERGRRPGTMADFEELIKLVQGFDVLHTLKPVIEPQDAPIQHRHYATMRAQLTLSDKVPFVYARGAAQAADCFEMTRIARGLSQDAFRQTAYCQTVINTNSPRQIDIPMARGIIDFAAAGQLSIITPFCLAGAMAPVTMAGALTLQHAEAMAGVALAQLTRPGAPVLYGAFASNVDMKSGAPAFGTPEHVTAAIVSGQLARRLGLPWRSAAGCAANTADAQAAGETAMSLWASVLGGSNMVMHAAGWLEGGLTHSYEKLISDVELLEGFAELCIAKQPETEDLAFDAIAEVPPGGHFFGAAHTMSRYQTAFYAPLLADWSNFGQWTENGARTAAERATRVWKERLANYEAPEVDPGVAEALEDFSVKRRAEGGAPPES